MGAGKMRWLFAASVASLIATSDSARAAETAPAPQTAQAGSTGTMRERLGPLITQFEALKENVATQSNKIQKDLEGRVTTVDEVKWPEKDGCFYEMPSTGIIQT